MSFKPCFIIPIYNHKETIAATLARLERYARPCIIVDDGSDAATQAVLAQLAAQKNWVQLHRLAENQGKGAAVMQGIRLAYQAGYSHALQVDADGQHDVADVPTFFDLATQHPNALIYGTPIYDDSIPRGRLIGRYITHFWVCVEILTLNIVDTMCGFRLYPLQSTYALINKVRIGRRMDFDTDIMVRLIWEQVPIRPVATKVIYPENGVSHFDYVADNVRISLMHTRLVLGMLIRLPWLLYRKFRPQPKSTVHWAKIPERGAAWGIQLMLWVYRHLGRGVFNLLLFPVMGYFFLSAALPRRASQQYLHKVYAHGSTHPNMAQPPTLSSSFHHFMEFGRAALDRIASWQGDLQRNQVDFDNEQTFIDLAEQGRGGVIIGAHLGNIEVSRALAGDENTVRMTILMFTEHAANYNAILEQVNPKVKDKVIQVNQLGADTAIMLQDKVEQGELIVILGDRTPINSNSRVNYVDFLGEPAPFSQGTFILASLLQCPVYLMFCLKKGQRYRVYFEHFADSISLPRQSREQALQHIIQKFAHRLEYYCLQEPFQWFNFFDFWHKGLGKN